jgi:hypothetical protein
LSADSPVAPLQQHWQQIVDCKVSAARDDATTPPSPSQAIQNAPLNYWRALLRALETVTALPAADPELLLNHGLHFAQINLRP